MNYNDLLNKATNIQKNQSIGLNKDLNEYAFTFVYPPPQCLHEINEKQIIETKTSKEANIYVHIPFCTGKCTYCYFCRYDLNNTPVSKSEYVNLLCEEIALARKKLGDFNISSIHIGGGTPTILTENELEKVFFALRENFNVSDKIEITCESSPETLNKDKIHFLLSLGVNRLNIGVQSFDDDILKIINRRHNSLQAKDAITLAQQIGIKNINIDLMYGLPEQKMDSWVKTLSDAINLRVQSISTYRLRLHPKGELSNKYKISDDTDMLDRYVKLLDVMEESGYIQASSHKFASQEEFMQKQILSKRGIKNNELLSFGLSSYGYIGNTLYWNQRKLEDYKLNIDANKLPCSIGYILDIDEQKSKSCVLGLHNYKGINMLDYKDFFNSDLSENFGQQIEYLIKLDLLKEENSHLSLTKLGMIFADEIALMFYSPKIKNILHDKKLRYGIFFDEVV